MRINADSKVSLHTGRKMPILGLGTWKVTGEGAAESIMHALDLGYRMIDTASDYGSHGYVAEALKNTAVSRDDIFLVTKVEEKDDAYSATKNYLRQLDQKYVDLMLIHRPPKDSSGEDLWQGLIQAKKEGLAKDIGVSNYSIEQIEDLIDDSNEVPVVNQIEWSPFGHSLDMLDYCGDNGIIVQAYSSLTHGKRVNDDKMEEMAEKYGKSPAQIFIRWNMQLGVVPIIKAKQKRHQEENLNVFDFEISDEDMETIESFNEQYSALGELAYV